MNRFYWATYQELQAFVEAHQAGRVTATLIWQVLADRAIDLSLNIDPPGSYRHCSEKRIPRAELSAITPEQITALRPYGLAGKAERLLRQFLADRFGALAEEA